MMKSQIKCYKSNINTNVVCMFTKNAKMRKLFWDLKVCYNFYLKLKPLSATHRFIFYRIKDKIQNNYYL